MPRKRMLDKDSAPKVKRTKVSHHSHCTEPGLVLTLGQGDLGQLGLGPDVLARKRPALVELPENIIQAEAGGVHTVCLSGTGKIYTFGCNDEGALGRDTSEEGSDSVPGLVDLTEKVVQVSAGDSHTAALTDDGRVFIWGAFRDENGVIGLLAPLKGGEGLASASGSSVPVELQLNVPIVKIASGSHHLALVSMTGILYTCGCGDNGQLGRVHPVFTVRGGRKGLERLLLPQPVIFKQKGCRTKGHVRDVFCGSYSTIAITEEGHVIGFGLSNYYQLGSQNIDTYYSPKILTAFKNSTKSWIEFSAGQHHTVCLDSEGTVYSLGRADYGMLGLGEGVAEKNTPIAIPGLPKSTSVACGERVGYAVTEDGCAFAWGMGSNLQLATGEEDDAWSPVQMSGQQLQNRTVLSVKGGGQHTVLLVKDRQS
ncbi:regulator of chromosome condensation isoform X1 [Hemicordylus capensis]|uniref:regulator of chromosome condensation isoform X1 n=1 Tax=Hemicordylus capensis TaxID=884348 RepID=UPI0023036F19|nr:regulator of chromosome condensation isoform X1 [Hemicordylus capensis]XP_053124258.1 regulator of chromosome condensation isoform X1 [Hemicordylus capensis]XP_053124259.1 regulator of chromosome condensation isoform X1 [Hemicordylus capensis]XP_053124260.1 regulator of chromosome condensation isoform X1 [Hemicordylus capensis]